MTAGPEPQRVLEVLSAASKSVTIVLGHTLAARKADLSGDGEAARSHRALAALESRRMFLTVSRLPVELRMQCWGTDGMYWGV